MMPMPSLSLLRGEKMKWSGQPSGGLLFTPSDMFAVPFTFAWCGFALNIFWQGGRSFFDQPLPFSLFPLLFVAIGLFMAVGRFLLDLWLRARTRYAITDRRVMIERAAPFGQSISLTLGQIPDVRLRRGRGGRGTIAFGDEPSILGRRGFGSMVPSLEPTPQLLAINDAEGVYALIQRLIDDAAKRQPSYSAFS